MESKMLIGQFADTTSISKRMLRHYDKIGLIKPHIVDEQNGYRYYTVDQLPLLRTIVTLGKYGFTLNEIKDMMTSPITKADFLTKLKDKEAVIRLEVDEQVTHMVNIKKSIDYLEHTKPGLLQLIDLESLTLERSPVMEETNTKSLKDLKAKIGGLPTSELFLEKMEDRIKANPESQKFFITFDLDQFAPINQDFGFDVGDNVIFHSMNLLLDTFEDTMNEGHCIASRFGGDELVFYIEKALENTVIRKVESALSSIANYDLGQYGCPRQVTSSCGVCSFETVGHVQEPRHHSALALLEGKREGRNQYRLVHA